MFNLLKQINEQALVLVEKKEKGKKRGVSKDMASAVYHRDYESTKHKNYRQNQ